jgi:hypothetical protein
MAKTVVKLFGWVLLLVGIVGFFNKPVLGIFAVDVTHNIIHLVSGLIAIVMARKGEMSARTFAKVFGVIYALVAVLGFVSSDGTILGFITANSADTWLHVALAVVFLGVGFTGRRSSGMGGMNQPMM